MHRQPDSCHAGEKQHGLSGKRSFASHQSFSPAGRERTNQHLLGDAHMTRGLILASVFLAGCFRYWLYLLLAARVLAKKETVEKQRILLGGAGTGGFAVLIFLLPVPEYGQMLFRCLL